MTRARQIIVFYVVAVLFMAACALIATSADAWLAPAPRFDVQEQPLVIEGERLLECLPLDSKSIEVLPEGARLYENLDLIFHAPTEGAATTPLFIVARGRQLDGVWPLLTLRVDRRLRAGFFVTSREWGLYRVELELPPGDHRFRISYANDRSRFPTNRDLDISKLSLGAPPPGWEGQLRWRKESVLPASRFAVQKFAEAEGEAVRLWKKGYLADDIFYPTGGMQKVSVRAESASETHGRLALLVDGAQVEEFEVMSGPSRSYRAMFDIPAGLHQISLVNRGDEILVRHLMADGAAPVAPSTAEPLSLGAGLTIPARMFVVEAEGKLLQDGSRLLWSNGHIGRTISNETARAIRLTLVARGEMCEGEGPRALLMVDDDQLLSIDVDSVEFRPYAIDVELQPGEHRIVVVYVNDRFVPGICDRNLYLRELRLEGAP